ncbi:MAG TPA: S41 family peptidase [Trueperaceae bacterium]
MSRRHLLIACLLCLLASGAVAQGNYAERFERAWSLVAERYWSLEEIDWQAVGEEYRDDAVGAASEDEFYDVLERMYEELDDDHSVFVPPERVAEIREEYGDLPCLPVLAQSDPNANIGRVSFRLIGQVGYLKVPDLASPWIAADTRDVVGTLVSAGADSLILDLRGNPGGRLVEMMQLAGIFTRGFLWRVVTRWSLPIPYPAIGAVETELPLAILTDGRVNSAAEGLAGALQQAQRAVIVGEPTAGNVEAVLPFCLRDGSQAWIATGVLAPIGAPTWEGEGVKPDIPADADEALEAALRYLRGM